MNSLLEALKAAAEKATPGPWSHQTYSNYPNGYSVHAEPGCISERWQDGLSDTEAETLRNTGKYIALCSPENILALVKALEEARELAEGCTNACIFDYPGEKEFVTSGICTCREKARAFLEKYFKNERSLAHLP